jgi:glutamate racemase
VEIVNDAPIGIFDSGVGGLTVARAVSQLLPRESVLYIGDTAHSPYGPKPIADVRRYSLEVLDTLVDQGVKMLVIACNTASAAMLRDARERYDVPVVEVIGPAVRTAISTTRNRRVGVIGTVGTIGSGVYQDMLGVNEDLSVFTQACPRFVEFVEAGVTGRPRCSGRRGVPRAAAPRGRRHARARLHALPVPRGRDQLRHGAGRLARLERHRDRQGRLPPARLARPARRAGCRGTHVYEATGDSADDFLRLADRLMGRGVSAVRLVQTGAIDLPHP